MTTAAAIRLAAVLVFCAAAPALRAQTTTYEVDLNDRSDDRFDVTVRLEALAPADSIFQFAATAPGTYQVMDIGRYVEGLTATDAQGREVPVTRVGTNQWRFSEPGRVRTVRYRIAETWDTPVPEHVPYLMCGTSIEKDNVFLSPHAVLGYPERRQAQPVRVRFDRPEDWKVGSALVPDADGWYHADDYDQLIDSPFLMGSTLTEATLNVGDVPVEVWVYSSTGKIRAGQLLGSMRSMLTSAAQFLGGLPVNRYAFLWHFENQSAGAWEHSYSSEYVLQEPTAWTPAVGRSLTDIAAHEFFHVMTPLNIHSEVIEHFDFEHPTPSQHVWLYEGVTEWASDVMQLRSNLIQLPEYLDRQVEKIVTDRRYYDADYSLRKLALTSYTDEGQRQYGNIYMRGAVVAGLLDIRLLELSGGKRGLRELILDLSHEYGKDRPFPEDGFFDILTKKTYPEIGDFLDRYVKAAEPLPIAEYYAKLGIRFVDGDTPRFEIMPNATPAQIALREAWMRGRPAA
jgi:predicted metalloprotease with PDZ domain